MLVEPQSADLDLISDYAPLRWPEGLERPSGESHPCIAWGEEAAMLPLPDREDFRLEMPIVEDKPPGDASRALRIELSAYEISDSSWRRIFGLA